VSSRGIALGAKFTAPSSAMPEGWGFYLSGEAGAMG
jgi:hypothetical protein